MTTPNKNNPSPAKPGVTDALARSYVEHLRNPKSKVYFDRFGDQLNSQLNHFLPEGSRGGCLKNREEDLRQEAALCLLTSLLAGNKFLAHAVRADCIDEIGQQINCSIRAAIKYVCLNNIRRNELEERHHPKVVELFAEWASAKMERVQVEKMLAEAGWKDHTLTVREFQIVSAVLAGTPRKEVSVSFGISASGISRLLERTAKALSRKNKPAKGLQL
jgi:hypothetical protein